MNLSQYTFNLFEGGIKVKKPTGTISLTDALALISGPTYQMATQELRGFEPELRRVFKADFDYVTFSGTFAPSRAVKNLKQHSGLICLDFDHVANLWETRLQLQSDPHTLALFTSPSGDGLKVIFAVPDLAVETGVSWEQRQKDAFADIAFYMRQTYGLDVDASGSDVSRACFLPHDAQAFTNAQAEAYVIKGLATKIVKPKTEHQVVKDATDVYRHVLAVVERIEAAQVNITGDEYNTWYILAFCMASLGENGRDLLHRISQLSDKYDQAKTDEKFDEAVKNCRFTTPWKFFDLCKEQGVDVSKSGKPKKEKPLTTNVGVSQVPDSQPTDSVVEEKKPKKDKGNNSDGDLKGAVWYRVDHQIWIKGKGWNVVADNFLIYIRYVTEDENENLTWILEIQPDVGKPIFIEVPHDDFTSASKLRKIITGKQYALKLSDTELSELQAYLFKNTKFEKAIKIIRYGYHVDSGVYFFANQAIANGQKVEPDEFGMIKALREKEQIYLSMPQNNRHRANRFSLTGTQISINAFFRLYAQAQDSYEIALLPFAFYLMSVFRDVAIKHSNYSPIIYMKGPGGSGKSSVIRHLTAAFGKKQEGVNLKGKTTAPALIKITSQASNAFVWFDEFDNDLDKSVLGLIQAMYDNDGYHLSKMSAIGTNETDSIDIYSSLALTSNYLPENVILFSRFIFIPVMKQDKTDDQRKVFQQLEDLMDSGLGCLTVELLQYRDLVVKEFPAAFELLHKRFRKAFVGEKVPERFFSNMAKLLSVAFILSSAKKVQLTESTDIKEILESLAEVGIQNIRRQHRIMGEKTALSEFFEIIQGLYDKHQIHEELHFDFKKVGSEYRIRLWFPQLYNFYAQEFRRINSRAPVDKDTLQIEIAAFEEVDSWEEIAKPIRFLNDGESRSNEKTTPRSGSCTMNYLKVQDKYGLNLEGRKSRI